MTFRGFLRGAAHLIDKYRSSVNILSISARQSVLSSLLRILTRDHLTLKDIDKMKDHKAIGGVAAALASISHNDSSTENLFVRWLSTDGVMQDLAIRRAVIAALAKNSGKSYIPP